MRKLLSVLALCLLGTSLSSACWAKPKTYIAVGDSYAYGYTTDNPADPNAVAPQSYGETGYVSAYAEKLQKFSPDLQTVNIAIPGESSSTFFTGGSPGGLANLNYTAVRFVSTPSGAYPTNAVSQYETLLAKIAQAHAAGRDVSRITIHLGGNDLQALLSDPAFVFGDDATRANMAGAALQGVGTRYGMLLATLKQAAPEARVVLLNYPNPFRPLADPPISNPMFQGLDPLVQGLNGVIAGLATYFGAGYVDVFTPFFGHEGQWTYILDSFGSPSPVPGAPRLPNVHPNADGYDRIADLLDKQEDLFEQQGTLSKQKK